MRLQKRIRFSLLRYRTLVLLLIPLFIALHRPPPRSSSSSTKQTLPIHQISLSPCHNTHTTNVVSSITLPPSKVLSHISKLPNSTIIFLTAGCLTHSPNTRQLLYLTLLTTSAPAVVPFLQPPNPQTLSHLLPIIFRAASLQNAQSLETALETLHPKVVELPAATASSNCDIFQTPLSRTAITNRSAKNLPHTLYGTGEESLFPPPISPIPYVPSQQYVKTVVFVMPWLQMGGAEQCMFHLAQYAKRNGYRLAFVVTQPFWGETDGRLVTRNDWIDRAYQITGHVLDLVNVAPYHQRARVLRYFLESLEPEIIMTGNSRLFYQFLPFVRGFLKDVAIADYNHMVHIDWRGGGMPRYAANNTEFIDRHFAASDNVTNAIKGWIRDDGYDDSKARTCYIGADVERFHTGVRKTVVRRTTRAKLGIANDKVLVLFAGRFVLDKGIDVLAEVVQKLKSDVRFAFLVVGTGPMQDTVLALSEEGRVVTKPRATPEEMRDYYVAGDILLLPSVKEGIALVMYEAMANGLLVISTDVGGQKEVVTADRGVLLQRGPTAEVAQNVSERLEDVVQRPEHYNKIRETGEKAVREHYTTQRFCECVFDELHEARREQSRKMTTLSDDVLKRVGKTLKEDRAQNLWAWHVFPLSVSSVLTIGIMDGCGAVEKSVESVKESYGNVSISIGSSFEEVLQGVDTELVMILPAGYTIGQTDMQNLVNLVRRPARKVTLDMVGIRVDGGSVGRLKREDDEIVLCQATNINEFGGDGGVLKSLDAANVVKVGTDVLRMDWLNAVFVVRSERLKEVAGRALGSGDLFVEAFKSGWYVGYVHEFSAFSTCASQDRLVAPVHGVRDVGDCGLSKDDPWYRIKF